MPVQISITAYPNNEIRARLSPSVTRRMPRDRNVLDEDEHLSNLPCQCPDSILDISAELKPTMPGSRIKPGYGAECKPTKFGTYARRQLLRVGGVIDKIDTNPENGVFLTGTLPGSTHDAKQAIANYSAYAVNCLKSWISKRVPEKLDFYVWELQRRGALHLHYFVYVPNDSSREYILGNFSAEWTRILDSISVMAGIDVWRRDDDYTHADDKSVLQAYAQTVNKSVAAYLSKYCSKQSQNQSSQHSIKYFPSRWWGASRPLLAKLRDMTVKDSVELVSCGKARAIYEELTAELERYSIKGYRYGDKVGFGLNHVFYFHPEEHQSVMQKIQSEYVPTSTARLLAIGENVSELARIISTIDKNPGVSRYFTANLSDKSSAIAESLRTLSPIDSFQAFALSSEIAALSVVYSVGRSYSSGLVRRVELRSGAIANFFQNDVLIEGLVPFATNPVTP